MAVWASPPGHCIVSWRHQHSCARLSAQLKPTRTPKNGCPAFPSTAYRHFEILQGPCLVRNSFPPTAETFCPSYALRVGRICTSLRKLPGAAVTIAATTCATFAACSALAVFLALCPENSVATEPGQTALTRIPCARNSSAMQPVRPMRPHLEAQ